VTAVPRGYEQCGLVQRGNRPHSRLSRSLGTMLYVELRPPGNLRRYVKAAIVFGVIVAAMVIACRAFAAQELYSFTWGAWGMPASGPQGDQIVTVPVPRIPFPGYYPACCIGGVMPATPFTIVGVEICHLDRDGWLQPIDPSAFVMIGETQPNGDAITPYKMGEGCIITWYPAGTGFQFMPGRDELHMHTQSGTPHSVRATIYYTVP
jgi:hypothetical protein